MALQLDSLEGFRQLLTLETLCFLAPCLASCAAIIAAMRLGRSPLILPAVLAAIPAAFHLVLLAGGWSLADAQNAGWVAKPAVSLTTLDADVSLMQSPCTAAVPESFAAATAHPGHR